MRTIGEMARASGLGVSALRYYDSAGVLVPAAVDPVTGYRRYGEGQILAARLIAGLRRVGMPVVEIARAVAELPDTDAVRKILDEHLLRLEDGLAEARQELSRLHRLLAADHAYEETIMTTITLPADDLAGALAAVRFAASADPELPMINGVLAEAAAGSLTLVATDRFRMAVAQASARVSGPSVRVVAPLPFVDALRPLLTGEVTLDLSPAALSVVTPAGRLDTKPLDVEFPDYQRLSQPGSPSRRVTVDPAGLRAAVRAAAPVRREHDGVAYEVTILTLDPAGTVRTAPEEEWAADTESHVAVNREFLLQALDAGGPGQLVLELDGPIKPLAVRGTEGYSLLMPVRH
ncbi:MerR family DNA-binding transcriptional regulator [Actinoplanes sp. N902-109]|uniref:DNA polymerase III subunit beta family protein n=1 Tax=Actinoplanes sp. (strain N902-109) TaxID=649831 RepID=UPI0003295D4A|nr:MerR family DNA-binding transcriptional regulator [Actinoplanes sp. N902-109]AGL20802.1 MerR family transcriptional regulator [Actinoplanes sp. N902-109]